MCGEITARDLNLDSLLAEEVDQGRGLSGVALIVRNDPGVRRARLSAPDASLGLGGKVLEKRLLVIGDVPERDQDAGQGNRGIERSDRRARGQPETAEPAEKIDVAEPDQAKRDAENHDADQDLHDQARRAVDELLALKA